MEQTQSPHEFLVQRRSVVRVMAWLYDRSKLKHIEILFILQVISHPGSPPLSIPAFVRFLNENLNDSGLTGNWMAALNEAGLLEFRFDFDCRGEARRLESGARTIVYRARYLARAETLRFSLESTLRVAHLE